MEKTASRTQLLWISNMSWKKELKRGDRIN